MAKDLSEREAALVEVAAHLLARIEVLEQLLVRRCGVARDELDRQHAQAEEAMQQMQGRVRALLNLE